MKKFIYLLLTIFMVMSCNSDMDLSEQSDNITTTQTTKANKVIHETSTFKIVKNTKDDKVYFINDVLNLEITNLFLNKLMWPDFNLWEVSSDADCVYISIYYDYDYVGSCDYQICSDSAMNNIHCD